ncbi:bifunctional helix-turn-helix transcriptional regulator/GNAT family N-acetyltransferase [Sphingomonas sp. BIUV-7]|uniref:Bifunctional helix-turn-helix transcriptional regulator/GNAT family N-acetyltransferase n=1 Tax=Sphingomonas natans TaxID=3063330 RepID=A0ABT8YAV8_9SPHN|nr:bifunctional helix-turn-helix transcriptional regulator/GNAT family N-acetyltransferase [Sphingomonas sp. BIUV-7]MDO6415472.1 bifunctional helix-turn-helix transcriptional regulator/GNAT family N-acetyltransferase [Sphingomonas sp. BIUV-7]
MRDIVSERTHLFLGSRLKRLAERMQADVVKVGEQAGLAIQPSQYPLLATLDLDGAATIGELTEATQLSQPAITRNVAKLVEMGMVEVTRRGQDQRQKTVALTAAGQAALARAKLALWPQIEQAVAELLGDLPGSFVGSLSAIEARLATRPLHRRAAELAGAGLVIREFSDELAPHFRTINAQWIERMYRLEQADIDVLDHPRERIIDKGGVILFVEAPGLGIVGACALRPTGPNQYELTKMGVLESARGLKVGEFLLRAVLERAEAMGIERLYLLSNRKSEAAIHLYEKLGFAHDAGIMAEFGAGYERCDVAMLYKRR